MLTGLQAILDKEVVLSTVNADDLLHHASKVEADYARHVATFIPMGDTGNFSKRIIKLTTNSKTPKGLIIADYGYGKTSTLAFLWHECEQQDIVAVPPFYCASLLDMLKATYGWVKFRLEQRQPGLINDLDEVYQKYTAATVEEMAERYAHEHGIAKVTAVGMLKDMLEGGSLVLELTPSNLLFFLDAVSAITLRAGFKGLVLFPDEFQQYFSKGANLRRIIQEFREFVWGLDTRSSPLGVVLSIPDYAESVIQEQGRDVLHRLKKDNLYYRLQDIYTVEFPTQLWQRYVEIFDLNEVTAQVMHPHTLHSIGQITERRDLGEGPRTVIDSFKRAILHYDDHKTTYTPIELIDDFLESNIRFQAQTNKLKSVVRQVLSSSIMDTSAKVQAVKLIAAFPRGCPVEVQKHHQLYDAVVALSKQSHGEIMVRTAEGDTLLGLNRSEVATRTVDMIITRFWQTYEEDELHKEAAMRAFTRHLLPRFFQQRRGATAVGWGELKFSPSTHGSYTALIEGSFNPQYPRRRVSLQVAYDDAQMEALNSIADLQFDFLFVAKGETAAGQLTTISERLARFTLNVQQKISGGLPDDIRKLQEYVLPEFVTPLLMLSLIDYFERWEKTEDRVIPETDRGEIEHLTGRLIGHAIQALFDRELSKSVSPPLRRVGLHMIEELFNRYCKAIYPHYHTFFVQAQYESVLNDYINAMRDMTLKERRGHATIESTKESLARRFGLGSVATFENRIENEYAEFMEKGQWKGRGDQSIGEIKLKPHALETAILEKLRSSAKQKTMGDKLVSVLEANTAANIARELGYRDEETLLALQLLAARGYTRFDQQEKIIYLAQIGPDPAELRTHLENLVSQIAQIQPELLPPDQLNELQTSLAEAQSLLEASLEDEEELDELQTRINDLEQRLSQTLAKQRGALQRQLNESILEIERALISLRQSGVLDQQIQGQVAFVMHLNEVRQSLDKKRRTLAKDYETQKDNLKAALKNSEDGGPVEEILNLYAAQQTGQEQVKALVKQSEELSNFIADLKRWIKILKDTDQLFNALNRLPEIRKRLTQEVIPEIQAFFTKNKDKGLAQWEIFATKLQAITDELESHRRHGNEQFGQVKESYETSLRELSVRDYRPHTRYTYGEDQESYQDLYEDVRSKIEKRLQEIRVDLQREQTDLLKAKYIHNIMTENRSVVQAIEQHLQDAETKLRQLHKALTVTMVRNAGEELNAFTDEVKSVANVIENARQQLGPLIFQDHSLSEQELEILTVMENKPDLDLTDLFVDLRQAGKDITLDDLLDVLGWLYRKNRVLVRIRRRG